MIIQSKKNRKEKFKFTVFILSKILKAQLIFESLLYRISKTLKFTFIT